MSESLRAALRGGGRCSRARRPRSLPGFIELARDADVWVAQLDAAAAAGAPVAISRRAPR